MKSIKSSPTLRVLLVANWDWVLYNFRLPLAHKLAALGLDVMLLCPPGSYSDEIRAQGFTLIDWELDRKSKNPFRELLSTVELARLYRQLAPDAVHHFTIKPILYGSLAAKFTRVPIVINNFTGLGYLFSADIRATILRVLTLPFLALLARAKGVYMVFQNRDDHRRLAALGVIPEAVELIIEGTGVDLRRFKPAAQKAEPPVVLMAARLLLDKGVKDFVEAALRLRSNGAVARFWVAGRPDPANPSSIPPDILDKWKKSDAVTFLGHRADMDQLLAQATIAVLPSYHEGVPLFLLEAAATGLPLVGSDIEGCRMVIEDGRNGYLVPVGDAKALAEVLQRLLKDSEMCAKMGQRSREIAESRFGQDAIQKKYERLYVKLGILENWGE